MADNSRAMFDDAVCGGPTVGQDEGVSVSGSDPGAAGNDRPHRPGPGVPVGPEDEYGEDQTTTALPRPPRDAGPDRPRPAGPRLPPVDPGWQATTAIQRPPPDQAHHTPPYRTPPPLGPSWAGQGPYQADPHQQAGDHPPDRNRPPSYPPPSYRPDVRQPDVRQQDLRQQDARFWSPPDQERGGPVHRSAPDGYREGDDRRDRRYQDRDYQDREGQDYRGGDHPEFYRDDGYGPSDVRRQPPPRGSHLPPYQEPLAGPVTGSAGWSVPGGPQGPRSPRKLTVTRVAALRSRELTARGVQMFHRATTADGADKSGLTALTYAVMANYAVDAVLAVALAGTLFFAAATAESTGRVLLYLVITVAPFAVIAPFIGPMLDRLQSGRRLALALSSFGRALLAILMAFNFSHFNPWVIYPCALGNLVLSKAFGVLKAALTPRVLPEQITLVKTNARLTTFGMIAGGVAGAIAAGLSKIAGSPGALVFMAICAVAGGVLCLRIPAWVESTEGEVPVKQAETGAKKGFPQIVVATLWANSMIRVETGFLALFIAFVVKSQYPKESAFTQLLLLGVVGAAAGVGGFIGNTMGARFTLSAPETISIFALVGVVVSTLVAVLVPGLATAAIVGFVGSTASSLAKVSLDSVIQNHLPEASRASGFGKSESVLQLGWVFGGVVGLLLGGVWTFGHANVYAIGFGTITLILLVGLAQSWLVRSGKTMLPKLSGRSDGRPGRRARKSGGMRDTDRLTRPGTVPTTEVRYGGGPEVPRTAPYSVNKPDPNVAGTSSTGQPSTVRRRIRKAGK